jgi:DnaJ-class molecular chaperone
MTKEFTITATVLCYTTGNGRLYRMKCLICSGTGWTDAGATDTICPFCDGTGETDNTTKENH